MKTNLPPAVGFQELLDKFSVSMKATFLKFELEKNGIDPEDVLQEIRAKLWKRYSSEKKMPPRASYINRVVNSALIDFMRRARLQAKIVQDERCAKLFRYRLSNPGQPDEFLLKKAIGDVCETLIDHRRRVVELFLLNMTLEEIARALSWSEGKTRNLLYRGLSDMRRKLKERGIEYENR
ncbi:MAG: RNA polymerase sigma factor [Acidobacteriota bacterium]